MARFAPGDLVYHNYGEVPAVYHERLVLAHVDHLDFVICTPDRDVYTETLDNSNADLVSFHIGGANGALPPELVGWNVYGFGVLGAREYRNILDEGNRESLAERGRRGLAAPAPPAGPVPAAAPAGGDAVWVLAEMVNGFRIGDEVVLAANAVMDGDYALHHMNDGDGKARVVLVSKVKRDDLSTFCEERIQLCRDAEAADHFLQTGFRPGGAIVVPSLAKYVSEKLHQEGQIMKERRKLREERGHGRGRGRGQPGKQNPGRGICRSVKQRCFKRAAVNKRVNLAITALNSLFFGNDSWEVPQTCHDLRALPSPQRDAIQNIIKCVKDAGGPPKGACYSEALKALRVASNGYFDTAGGVGDTVAMNLQLLSLPSLAGKGVDLASTLEGKAGEMLRDFESHMLQHDVNWGAFSQHTEPVKPYSDPQLSQRGFYGDFLARLQQCGILAFSLQPRGRVGAFCVSKKPKEVDGRVVQRQRLILDCRQTNMLFRAPPLTELGSLSALSEGYLRPQDDLFIGGADIQDCFYACKIPPELSRYFCLSQDITVGEAPVGDFASNRCLGMPYCDNVHVLSTDENQCEDGRKQVCAQLRNVGFGVHEEIGNFPIEDVESVGSWNERWRFKRLDPEHWRPRERSLHYNVFLDHSTARRPEPLAEDSFEYEENPEFPEVPFDMLNPKNWSTAKMGMWRRTSDHITLKEGKITRTLRGAKPVKVPGVKMNQIKSKEERHLPSRSLGGKIMTQRTLKMATALEDGDETSDEAQMSMLERVSVNGPQRRQYATYLRAFKDFCKEQGLAWLPLSPDAVLADFCDELFLDVQSAAVGEKTIAAVEFYHIELKGKLLRAKRALKGWRKLAPPKSRLPLPRPLAMGIAMIMLARGERDMALKLLLDFDCYLRPSEGMDLLGKHVIAPVPGTGIQFQKFGVVIRDEELGQPDKTGIFDNTLHFDNPLTKDWLGPALVKLAKLKLSKAASKPSKKTRNKREANETENDKAVDKRPAPPAPATKRAKTSSSVSDKGEACEFLMCLVFRKPRLLSY
ncbi:unnamed protein product [Cladocopium goreaui]|uniref:Acyl-protein thioesterase 1 n=1 Tax=Cladocopium goreaui TaxID=2562237 RepID=A0A9P1C057_9DINO|nr:unnamed protein product [Cladocopium goreaui]